MSNGTQLLIICILYIPGAQSYANCSSVYIRRAWLGHASCTTCCIVVTMEKLRRKNKRMGDRFAWPNLSSKERKRGAFSEHKQPKECAEIIATFVFPYC